MYLHVLVRVGSGHTGPSLQIRVGIKGSEMRSGVAVLEQVSLKIFCNPAAIARGYEKQKK